MASWESIVEFFQKDIVNHVLTAVVIAAITGVVIHLVTKAMRKLLNNSSNPLPSSSIIINIVRTALWFAGGSIILEACFGINANAIIAALGVGGIAVSLGFQDTLSNLIGGMQVTFMRIVSPGDNIEVGSNQGVVQDVCWRHTTIKDSLGQIIVIPNSVISKNSTVHLLPASRVAVPFSIPRECALAVQNSLVAESAGVCAEPVFSGTNTAHDDGSSKRGDAGASLQIDLDGTSAKIVDVVRKAVSQISPITEGPKVLFSDITEFGFNGKVIFIIEDPDATFRAADAAVKAIATNIG